MEKDQVVDLINKAIYAIKKYKIEHSKKMLSSQETNELTEIMNVAKELITESYTLGASGNICPRCSGSGRI